MKRSPILLLTILVVGVVSGQEFPWTELAGVPALPSGRCVGYGGWLACANGRVYAAKGRQTGDFYCYFPGDDTWKQRMSIPLGRECSYPDTGCVGTWDGGNSIYMTKGGNTRGFWRYDIAQDTWRQLPDVAPGAESTTVGRGAYLEFARSAETSFVYLLKGDSTEFLRYDIRTAKWQQLPDVANPHVGTSWQNGSWLCRVDDGSCRGRIYAHRAKYHMQYRFDIAAGVWDSTNMTGMPWYGRSGRLKKSGEGSSPAYFDRRILALKGHGTREFWMYVTGGDSWTELDTIPRLGSSGRPVSVGGGGSLTSAGGGLFYATKGDSSIEFWQYRLPTGLAEKQSPAISRRLTSTICRGSLLLLVKMEAVLLDIAGQRVMSLQPGENDVRSVSPGIYFVRREEDNSTTKVVVQR